MPRALGWSWCSALARHACPEFALPGSGRASGQEYSDHLGKKLDTQSACTLFMGSCISLCRLSLQKHQMIRIILPTAATGELILLILLIFRVFPSLAYGARGCPNWLTHSLRMGGGREYLPAGTEDSLALGHFGFQINLMIQLPTVHH